MECREKKVLSNLWRMDWAGLDIWLGILPGCLDLMCQVSISSTSNKLLLSQLLFAGESNIKIMDKFYTDWYLSEFKVYKMNMNKRLLFKRKNY